jgi:hypothetical protein
VTLVGRALLRKEDGRLRAAPRATSTTACCRERSTSAPCSRFAPRRVAVDEVPLTGARIFELLRAAAR